MRPLLDQEKLHHENECISFVHGKPQVILGKDRGFKFDHVFRPGASQVIIASETILLEANEFYFHLHALKRLCYSFSPQRAEYVFLAEIYCLLSQFYYMMEILFFLLLGPGL